MKSELKMIKDITKNGSVVNGDKVEVDENGTYHIVHNNYDEMIDKVMSDVEGVVYISSRGVADLFMLDHKHLMRDTINPIISLLNQRNELSFRQDNSPKVRMKGKLKSNPIVLDPSSTSQNDNTKGVDRWFRESRYKANNGGFRKQYLISSDGFILLMNNMGTSKKKELNMMRFELQVRIIERFRHFQTLLTLNFQDIIKDPRGLGKLQRRILTNSIKYKLLDSGSDLKDVGSIYALITKFIYYALFIPEKFHKDSRDSFHEDILQLISLSESMVASFLSTYHLGDKKLTLNLVKDLRISFAKAIHTHLDELKIIEITNKYFKMD